jgi:lipoate-protein ligase A
MSGGTMLALTRGVGVGACASERSVAAVVRHEGRCIATAASGSGSVAPQAYVSRSTNPWFNLAFEDHLFRTVDPAVPVCFLYRNAACVVVGRNQNPWKELNAAAMRSIDLPMVRRRSGGGTVYHDLGNTNYSFHMPRDSFDRRTHAELVARALNATPVGLHLSRSSLARADRGAYVNARNDICIRVQPRFDRSATEKTRAEADEQGCEERKVSGSAYKLVNTRAYHHGTMLLSASLGSLGSSLRNERGELLVTKGVASVPAPVANLSEAFADRRHMLTHDVFVHAVVAEFLRTHSAKPGTHIEVDESSLAEPARNEGRWKLQENFDELQSWEWVFGQTPEFTHRVALHQPAELEAHGVEKDGWGPFAVEIHSKHGIVLDAKLADARFEQERTEDEVRSAVHALKGRRYDELALPPPWGPNASPPAAADSIEGGTRATIRDALLAWLRTRL